MTAEGVWLAAARLAIHAVMVATLLILVRAEVLDTVNDPIRNAGSVVVGIVIAQVWGYVQPTHAGWCAWMVSWAGLRVLVDLAQSTPDPEVGAVFVVGVCLTEAVFVHHGDLLAEDDDT